MTTDVILTKNNNDVYDISFTSTGDIETSQSLDTAILMGIFTERRATESEVPESFQRRGWIGNESTPGFEMGSKLWQYFQQRASFDALTNISDVLREGQQWLVDNDIAENIGVTATLSSGVITAIIELIRSSSVVDKKVYDLWENTGNNI